MHPEMHVNWLALVVAVVASYGFGWIWHGPLFGKLWMRLMGIPAGAKPQPGQMAISFALGLVGTILTAYVLFFSIEIWRPSVWGIGTDQPFHSYGFWGGFFVWLGFYVPMLLGSVAWEGRSWSLFGLNAVYHFINLQILAMILAGWR
jgi:hypothetical protein